jgi:hypothetical protein
LNNAQFNTSTYVNLGLYSVNIDLSTLGTLNFSNVVNVEVIYNGISLGTTQLTASPYAFWAASSTATYSIVATSTTYLTGSVSSAIYVLWATNATCSVDNTFTIGGCSLTYDASNNNIVLGSSLSIQGNLEVTGDINISSVSYATEAGTAAWANQAGSLINTATATYATFATTSTWSSTSSWATISGSLPDNTDGTIGAYQIYVASAAFALTTGADLAEIYSSRENLEPGDVVVISKDIDNNIEKSKSPDSIGVAGVISTDPGLVINSKQQGYQLALVGKVPVKVTNEGGSIIREDLLTTSSTPGHAKKISNPKPGSIIGKALENFSTAKGTILVLVNLQ